MMKATKYTLFLLLLISVFACKSNTDVSYNFNNKNESLSIYVNNNSDDLVKWAAKDFANDLKTILNKEINLVFTSEFKSENKGIYIGTFGDSIIRSFPFDLTQKLENQWEKIFIIENDGNLFISGSDIRGTVYAIFEVAKRIGISPWKWWADVTPIKNENLKLELPKEGIEESPSVQFRGIFLNDEDWGLQPWAAKTFEPETNDIGPKTYEKIFQLLLRLKANTIWPAMHRSTKAFFKIPGNKEMAEKYHISIGTSHAEPMLRNNVDEWDKKTYGAFNYFTNSDKVKEYWQQRIEETKNGNNIISLGMRGIHDSGMEGEATKQEKAQLLETIFSDQREMLATTLEKPIEEIPQVFTLYKEVLDLYNNGLKVPDDVTLMWTDDNYGYIRRLSNELEQLRSGGSGVYYHLSYWGRPHDYLWLSTTQPGLIWYEMTRAYQNGAQKIWIANVGDIKPAEYNMEFFLDLAWDINSINATTINKHLSNWASREFGSENSVAISTAMQEYYRLAFLRKPEFMGWSRTEPTTETNLSEFSSANNEVNRRIEYYSNLIQKTDAIKENIPTSKMDAFYQLVEYPIKAAALMNFKFMYAQQASEANDTIAKHNLTEKAQQAYNNIISLTEKYNTEINGGKWENMMTMNPRRLPAYSMPNFELSATNSNQIKQDSQNFVSPIFIQAHEYSKAQGAESYTWETVESLGYSNSALTLFPLKNVEFSGNKPWIEYRFDIEKTGNYNIEVRCLPTHSNNYDHAISLELNNSTQKTFALNTQGRSEQWKQNVLRNSASIIYPVSILETGKHKLKIYVNSTGIVLDQIAISEEGHPKFYEIEN